MRSTKVVRFTKDGRKNIGFLLSQGFGKFRICQVLLINTKKINTLRRAVLGYFDSY